VSLQELQEKLNEYVETIRRNRLAFFFFTLSLGLILGLFALFSPTYYVAHASFHPETNSNNTPTITGSPLSFLLGSGGLDGNEADMMEEVLKSRRLSQDVVSDTVEIEGEEFLIADLILEKYPKGFSPIPHIKRMFVSPPPMTLEAKIIGTARRVKSGLTVKKEKSGFLTMDFSSPDLSLSEIIGQTYIKKLSQYYTTQKTAKAKINLDFFTERAAYVKLRVDSSARALANFQDRNRGLLFAGRMISAKEHEIKLDYLTEMYKTLVTSQEQAASQLQQDTPIIQVLDHPVPPFATSKKNVFLFLMIGLVLGAILSSAWITRKLLWEDLLEYIRLSLEKSPPQEY